MPKPIKTLNREIIDAKKYNMPFPRDVKNLSKYNSDRTQVGAEVSRWLQYCYAIHILIF